MENLSNLQANIEETMKSLDGVSSVEPKPYFYTRLQARMERELLIPRRILGWQFKPIYALSAVAFLLIVNVFTLLNLQKTKVSNSQQYNLYETGGF